MADMAGYSGYDPYAEALAIYQRRFQEDSDEEEDIDDTVYVVRYFGVLSWSYSEYKLVSQAMRILWTT